MMRILILIIMLLPCSLGMYASAIDSLLSVLDKTIVMRRQYEEEKERYISLIKDELKQGRLTDMERYLIQNRLFAEYNSYISDSALHYINENILIATRLNNRQWINSSILNKVHILNTSGLFVEAMELLKSLPRNTLEGENIVDYYVCFENLYLYQAEYATDRNYVNNYLRIANLYRDSIISLVPEDTYRYVVVHAPQLIDQGKSQEAICLLKNFLPRLKSNTREYAVATSILAFAYHVVGNKQKEMEARISSAIADIRAVVKENYSLCALAELLYGMGDLERANHYIKISMEDANYYTTRLRSSQNSKMLPLIDRAYQQEKEIQQQRQRMFITGICILSVFLLLTVLCVLWQMKKLSYARKKVVAANSQLSILNSELKKLNKSQNEANERLLHTNQTLTEANHIKEEYLGRFLSLSSSYISKMEEYRRILNKQAAAGKLEELYRTLKSDRFINQELKEFYHNFDVSFLKIFPNFVEEFNRLLPVEEQLHPKNEELLVTELRIFALIRLGITDSARIAEFLRYSITTIYTYRSKLKNKSLCKEDFEERVMKITSF